MKLKKADCVVETMRGTGPGGQHRNKTDSAVRITHKPTGISAYADERSQQHSRRKAWRDLEQKLQSAAQANLAKTKKARRDVKIHDHTRIRTYNYIRNEVIDHRTGKRASLKGVMSGRLDLLKPDASDCEEPNEH
jgi:peptide chain release factor 1